MADVTAAPSAPATSAAQSNEGQQNNQSATQSAADKASTQSDGAAAQAQQTPPADDMEEIKLGSVTGRVPKALAQTIKALERGFHTKAQEAAAAKNFYNIAQQAKQNPAMADLLFERLGIDADQYSQSRLQKRLEKELMSPEQRELAELKAYREQKQKEDQERTQKDEQEKLSAQEKVVNQQLRNDIFSAWQSSGLPAEPEFGAWIAAEMQRADSQGVDLSAKDAAATVKSKFVALIKTITSSLPPEQLEDFLGNESLSKWREHDVKRVTSQGSPKGSSAQSRPGSSPASVKPGKPKGMLSEKEYREYFANLANRSG